MAGWIIAHGWPSKSKRPFDCLCNNELIVPQSIRGIGTMIETFLLTLGAKINAGRLLILRYFIW